MLEVTDVNFYDLTPDEQNEQSNNGLGKEFAEYLKVTYNGKTIAIYSDSMKVEDCTFSSDLKWVKKAILEAYELGKLEA